MGQGYTKDIKPRKPQLYDAASEERFIGRVDRLPLDMEPQEDRPQSDTVIGRELSQRIADAFIRAEKGVVDFQRVRCCSRGKKAIDIAAALFISDHKEGVSLWNV